MQRTTFIGAVSAAVLSGVAPAMAQTKPPQIVVAPLPGPDVVGLYYAAQRDWFKDAGLDVVIQQVSNGAAGMSALIGGTIQVAYINTFSLAVAHTKGIPVVFAAPGGAYNTETPVSRTLVLPDSPIRTIKDLDGKIMGVPLLGDVNTIGIEGLLENAGMSRTSVHFVEIPPPSLLPALQAKRIDAMSVYEPFLSSALSQGVRPILKPYDSIALNFMIVGWAVEKTWAANNRSALATFTSVLNRGLQYGNAHHQDLTALISDYTKIPPASVVKIAYPSVPANLGVALIQPVIDAAVRYQLIPAGFPARELML